MSPDDDLTQRIRAELKGAQDLVEKKMFGGVAFMIRGNLACGTHRGNLIVRVGPKKNAEALGKPHTKPFDMTGKPMAGWVMVEPKGYETEADLKRWIQQGVEFALSLPAK